MNPEDIIRDIRKRCRLAMDGVISTSMREKGIIYKLNFGVPISKIKLIASNYSTNKDLAEALWDEDVRELKILATLLYPIDEFNKETADKWIKDVKYQEIREQLSINLLQNLKFAELLTKEWTSYDSKDIRSSGYWLLSVLAKIKELKEINLESYPSIWEDISDVDNLNLRNSAITALKFIGRISRDLANEILQNIEYMRGSSESMHQEVYDSLKFEFDYFYES